MTIPIDQLGFAPQDVAALVQAGIATNDDLWRALARNSAWLETIFGPDENAKSRVLEKVIEAGCSQASETGSSWRSRLLPDLLVLAVATLVLYGFFRDRHKTPAAPVPQVVVTAKGGLPAFHVFEAGDLGLRAGPKQQDAATSVADVVGRYSTDALTEGDVVLASKLNKGPRESAWRDRTLLQLKVQATGVLGGARLPLTVSLLVSPRITGAEKGTVLENVLLLSTTAQSDGTIMAVVAVQKTDAMALAALVGMSDIIVAAPAS